MDAETLLHWFEGNRKADGYPGKRFASKDIPYSTRTRNSKELRDESDVWRKTPFKTVLGRSAHRVEKS